MNKYYARDNRFSKKDAQIYGEELDRIRKQNKGKLRPVDVVKEAKNKNSPLHNYFEWNDKKAGELYRLGQARQIISHICEVVIVEGDAIQQRSFHSVTSQKEKCYVNLESVFSNSNYRHQLLERLKTELENATTTIKMFLEYDKKKKK